MKYFSTKEVASEIGIGRATLERWLASGKLPPPRTVQVGEGKLRHWNRADVARVERYKKQNYRKGRGRKKGKTSKTRGARRRK